jgi:exopolysaccharide biosynthesis predicted pyruvyltransferase EpsI
MERIRAEVATSGDILLGSIGGARDVTFVRLVGNMGDHLIYAGARALLREVAYREISYTSLESDPGGELAIMSGSGGWCAAWHYFPELLPMIERKFSRVIVFPTSFDVSVPVVRAALTATRATVFARERPSYEQIKPLCGDARLAHDTAFFFDFEPYRRAGKGTLHAYRDDHEAIPHAIPAGNVDISHRCQSLDEWLWTIARAAEVNTDRAHVMIAAAMLGKRVNVIPSNYHKNTGLAEWLHPYPLLKLRSGEKGSRPAGGLWRRARIARHD